PVGEGNRWRPELLIAGSSGLIETSDRSCYLYPGCEGLSDMTDLKGGRKSLVEVQHRLAFDSRSRHRLVDNILPYLQLIVCGTADTASCGKGERPSGNAPEQLSSNSLVTSNFTRLEVAQVSPP